MVKVIHRAFLECRSVRRDQRAAHSGTSKSPGRVETTAVKAAARVISDPSRFKNTRAPSDPERYAINPSTAIAMRERVGCGNRHASPPAAKGSEVTDA